VLDRLLGVYRGAFTGLPRGVWWLCLVGFINRSGTMVLPFLALYLTREHGFSTVGAGVVLGVYGLGAAAGTLAGGWLSDRIHPHRLQVWSLAAAGAGLLLLGRLEARWTITLGVAAVALASEAFRPANSTALALASRPGDRARPFALRRLAINLGMTFGPAVGGFLAVVDYGWLFIADGVTCLAAAAAAIPLLHPAPAAAAAAGVKADAASAATARRNAAAASPWRDRPFLLSAGLMVLLTVVLFQIWSTYPLTLRTAYGLTEDRIGLLLAINTLLIVAVEMALVQGLRRRSPLRLVAVGAVLLGGGLGLLPFGSSFAWAACGVVVWTFGEMLSLPLIEAAVADRAGAGASGRYMGIFATAFSLAFMLAPALGTAVYGRFGSDALWRATAAAGAVTGLGFWALAPRFERDAAARAAPLA
jgi:predicted MFS family arabinose efflux permease